MTTTAMHLTRPLSLLAPAACVVAALTFGLSGCTPAPEEPEHVFTIPPSDTGVSGSETDAEPAPGVDGAPIAEDDFPVPGLVGCAELVDTKKTTTDFDAQWRVEFLCSDRATYDANVATLDAAGYEHPIDDSLGSESYLSEWDHFITEGSTGGALDVDLKLTGAPGELEYVVLVTLRNE